MYGELVMQAVTLHAKKNLGFPKEVANTIMVCSLSSFSSIYYHTIWNGRRLSYTRIPLIHPM